MNVSKEELLTFIRSRFNTPLGHEIHTLSDASTALYRIGEIVSKEGFEWDYFWELPSLMEKIINKKKR
jgi:hypothetical protein